MMIDTLLDYWLAVFTRRLRDETDDELKMKIVKKAPFQDDPVRQAPYLLLSEDFEKGVIPEDLGEIGGAVWWIAHMKIRAAPRTTRTADRAYYLVDLLGRRLVYILRQESFAHPQGQGIAFMENRDWFLVTKVAHKVYGGEGEWLSYVEIDFFNRITEPGPFPYGAYPGTIEPS